FRAHGVRTLANCRVRRIASHTGRLSTGHPKIERFRHRLLAALERGKPSDSVERLQNALRYELAVNGLNFAQLYLGGLHSAYVRGQAFVATQRHAEGRPNFRRSSIIAVLWGWIPSARWHIGTSAERTLRRETTPRQRVHIRVSSRSGRMPTRTFRSSKRPGQNTPGCVEIEPNDDLLQDYLSGLRADYQTGELSLPMPPVRGAIGWNSLLVHSVGLTVREW